MVIEGCRDDLRAHKTNLPVVPSRFSYGFLLFIMFLFFKFMSKIKPVIFVT